MYSFFYDSSKKFDCKYVIIYANCEIKKDRKTRCIELSSSITFTISLV